LIEIGVRGANSKRSNQADDDGCLTPSDCNLDIRHSYWFIESKTYGKISVGHTGAASEAITEINLAHTKDIAKYSDVEDSGLGMLLRSSTNGGLSSLQWRRLIGDSGDRRAKASVATPSNTTARPLPAFTAPRLGVKTTTGMSACVTRASSTASRLLRASPTVRTLTLPKLRRQRTIFATLSSNACRRECLPYQTITS
jgi:hypothetical protein